MGEGEGLDFLLRSLAVIVRLGVECGVGGIVGIGWAGPNLEVEGKVVNPGGNLNNVPANT